MSKNSTTILSQKYYLENCQNYRSLAHFCVQRFMRWALYCIVHTAFISVLWQSELHLMKTIFFHEAVNMTCCIPLMGLYLWQICIQFYGFFEEKMLHKVQYYIRFHAFYDKRNCIGFELFEFKKLQGDKDPALVDSLHTCLVIS